MRTRRLDRTGQKLVEENMKIVHEVIYWEGIRPDDGIAGLSRDELIQEGYVWLCIAASTYQSGQASFRTYARRVVRNGLISYCRHLRAVGGECLSLDAQVGGQDGNTLMDFITQQYTDTLQECVDLLESFRKKKGFSRTEERGLAALELRAAGLDGPEIAARLSAPENHVRAWMSRAASKLRRDPTFLWLLKK